MIDNYFKVLDTGTGLASEYFFESKNIAARNVARNAALARRDRIERGGFDAQISVYRHGPGAHQLTCIGGCAACSPLNVDPDSVRDPI